MKEVVTLRLQRIGRGELRVRQYVARAQWQEGPSVDVHMDPSGLRIILDHSDGTSHELDILDVVRAMYESEPNDPVGQIVVTTDDGVFEYDSMAALRHAVSQHWIDPSGLAGSTLRDSEGETYSLDLEVVATGP